MCTNDPRGTALSILRGRGFVVVGPHGQSWGTGQFLCAATSGTTRLFNPAIEKVADVTEYSVVVFDARNGCKGTARPMTFAAFNTE